MSEQTTTLPSYPTSPDLPSDPWRTPPEPRPAPGADEPRRRGVLLLISVALAAGLVGGGAGAGLTAARDDDNTDNAAATATAAGNALDQPRSTADRAASPGSVEAVAADALPSVVSIEVSTATGGGEGSGIILSADGLILTNNHVVAAAASGGRLTVTFNDGRSTTASIVGRDPVTDLAVVKASDVSGLTTARLGRSAALDPGEPVVAIGSPLGLEGTVTSGIISAVRRPVRTGDASGAETSSSVIDAIQTDAAINPGNSGGALVNLDGQVVGINSAIATLGSGAGGQTGSIGLGFAIPIDQARRVARQLIRIGSASHAELGVSVRDAGTPAGAAVVEVASGGAAESAGLRPDDVITRVDDRAVDGADALIAAVRSHRPGQSVTLAYERAGERLTTTLRLGSDVSGS